MGQRASVDTGPDVPGQAATIAPAPSAEADNSSRIVEVYTDVLQLAIDLNGGDIIELSLREHLARLDNSNKPFVLLEDNDSLVYVSQSGLIGPVSRAADQHKAPVAIAAIDIAVLVNFKIDLGVAQRGSTETC